MTAQSGMITHSVHVCIHKVVIHEWLDAHLQAVVPSIYKVAHEDVVGVGHLTSGVKQAEKIMELAVDVPADLHARTTDR